MSNSLWKLICGFVLPISAISTVYFFFPAISSATETEAKDREIWEQLSQYTEKNSFDQVTDAADLRDIDPFWYEAVAELVAKYGCLVGYPDGTFRGTRNLSRYEFAAAVSKCLDQVVNLHNQGEEVETTDLSLLRRMAEEFNQELVILDQEVEDLENRLTQLEAQQFSTTAQLKGEVILELGQVFGGEKADGSGALDDNLYYADQVVISVDSSFTGRDKLGIDFYASSRPSLSEATGTDMASRAFPGDTGNDLVLGKLLYSFPVNDQITAHVGTAAVFIDSVLDSFSTTNFAFDSLSLFSQFNNLVYGVSNGGRTGIGTNIKLGAINLDFGYWAPNANDPGVGRGLFGGNYAAGAQIGADITEDFNLSLTYVHSYHGGDTNYRLGGGVGSPGARDPFNRRDNRADHFGLQAMYWLNPGFRLGGYAGYVNAESEAGPKSEAEIWNWAVSAAFPDLGGEGNLLALLFGMPPKLTGSTGEAVVADPDTSYLLTLEYRYRLTDNIKLIPGGYAIFNPNHNNANETIFVGVFRTEFTF